MTELGRNERQSGLDGTKRVRGVGILRRHRSMVQETGNLLSGPARTWLAHIELCKQRVAQH